MNGYQHSGTLKSPEPLRQRSGLRREEPVNVEMLIFELGLPVRCIPRGPRHATSTPIKAWTGDAYMVWGPQQACIIDIATSVVRGCVSTMPYICVSDAVNVSWRCAIPRSLIIFSGEHRNV